MICLQIIYSKSEALKIQNKVKKYQQIQELIHNYKGELNYEESFDKKVSSITIMFENED